jgi:hypothetical protein
MAGGEDRLRNPDAHRGRIHTHVSNRLHKLVCRNRVLDDDQLMPASFAIAKHSMTLPAAQVSGW